MNNNNIAHLPDDTIYHILSFIPYFKTNSQVCKSFLAARSRLVKTLRIASMHEMLRYFCKSAVAPSMLKFSYDLLNSVSHLITEFMNVEAEYLLLWLKEPPIPIFQNVSKLTLNHFEQDVSKVNAWLLLFQHLNRVNQLTLSLWGTSSTTLFESWNIADKLEKLEISMNVHSNLFSSHCFPNLRSLKTDIEMEYSNTFIIREIVNSCPTLESLNITQNGEYGYSGWSSDELSKLTQLRKLYLHRRLMLQTEDAMHLAKLENLEVLDLGIDKHSSFVRAPLEEFIDTLLGTSCNAKLKRFTFGTSGVEHLHIISILKRLPSATHIQVGDIMFSNEELHIYAWTPLELLSSFKKAKRIYLDSFSRDDLISIIDFFSNAKEFMALGGEILSSDQITLASCDSEVLELILQKWQKPSICSINLSNSMELTNKLVKQIVSNYPRLRILKISDCPSLTRETIGLLSNLKRLEEIDVSGNPLLVDQANIQLLTSDFPQLIALNISQCNEKMQDILPITKKLYKFNLSTSFFNVCEGNFALSSSHCTTQDAVLLLESMRPITDASISFVGVVHVPLRFIRSDSKRYRLSSPLYDLNSNMTSITISYSGGDSQMLSVFDSDPFLFHSFTSITLRDCENVSTSAMMTLLEGVPQEKSAIKTISISHSQFTDDVILLIATQCPNLGSLTVVGCPLTDKSLEHLENAKNLVTFKARKTKISPPLLDAFIRKRQGFWI